MKISQSAFSQSFDLEGDHPRLVQHLSLESGMKFKTALYVDAIVIAKPKTQKMALLAPLTKMDCIKASLLFSLKIYVSRTPSYCYFIL